jgi:adenine-specific DNA-methyltransferase
MTAKGPATNHQDVAIESVEGPETDVPIIDDGVFLSWTGRKNFRAAVPTPRVFVPVPEASDPTDEDPGNLVIEGDNRQALVSLFAQYKAEVDIVLIDVPYNTGKNDFRYDDARFQDPDADHANGDFVKAEDGGRHTKWLNQMAPTLWLIKELMAPHGVIFVHINDIELPRLLLLMEEIFDEKNRLGTIVWKQVTDNNAGRIITEHEYIVCYARAIANVPPVWRSPQGEIRDWIVERAEAVVAVEPDLGQAEKILRRTLAEAKGRIGSFARYYRLDAHWRERGPFASVRNTDNPGKPGYMYDVVHPITGKVITKPGTGYRFAQATFDEMLADDRIVFGNTEKKLFEIKKYISEVEDPLRSVVSIDARAGANDLAALFGRSEAPFKNPKPVDLEALLISYAGAKDALVLDCFAGSGTTGHAVMRLNKQDGGTRRFIMIEEGSPTDKYATALTSERLKRARTVEDLPGGFSFLRLGEQIDREAFATFQRHTVVEAIRQADASGRGAGIKPIDGNWVIGANSRRQAICLGYSVEGDAVTAADLREMFLEADSLGLARPLRVYGSACDILESDGFSFFQIPEELLANLSVGRGLRR